MGFFSRLLKRKAALQSEPLSKTLLEDIEAAKDWVAAALNQSGYQADFTLESLRELDRFFDEQHTPDGILSQQTGQKLFALGAYLGQVILNICGGAWLTNDNDPGGEINIAIRLDDGTLLFPVQRVIKRYANGVEDSLYAYAYVLVNDLADKQ